MLLTKTTTAGHAPSDLAALAAVPWRAILSISGALATLLLVVAGRPGYLLDELYTRAASEHLDWAQIDQPPLPALVAKLETFLFGDTLFAFRIVPALMAVVLVIFACLIARELGGSRRAQVFAAAATAGSGLAATIGHLLATNTFDVVAWVALCWLAIRLVRTGDTRLWLAIGSVIGLGLYGKYLIGLLVISLAVSVLLCGPRKLLRSKYLLGGAVIAVVLPAPVLVWQMTHGWPQFEMAAAVSKALEGLAAASFVPTMVLLLGLFVTPLWIAGLVHLVRRPEYRFVAVAFPVMITLLLITGGPANYASALQVVLLAAGCVAAEKWARTIVRTSLIAVALALNAVASVLLTLPILPVQSFATNPVLAPFASLQLDQAGWPEMTEQAAAVYQSLPAADRAHAIFYANHYGQAGALDKYGPQYGLPRAYSGHNSYADFGQPTDDKTVVITIGVDRTVFSRLFDSCEPAGKFEITLPVSDMGQEFMVCRGPVESWSQIWPKLRWIGFQCPYTTKAVTATSKEGCM